MRARCNAKRNDGERCRAPAIPDDPHGQCWAHSPALAATRTRWQRAGGRQRALAMSRRPLTPAQMARLSWWRLESLDHVIDAIRWVVRETAASRIDARTSHAMLASLAALRGTLSDRELDARLESLERRLNRPRGIA